MNKILKSIITACYNKNISGASSSHTAQLVNSNNKYRSSLETVSRGERQPLDVGVHDGQEALEGYKYKQKHVVQSLGTFAHGTFAVDDKYDF